jgi:hypothetical protein
MGAVLIGISRGSRSTGPESRRARNAWSRRCVRLKQARGRLPVDLVGALAHGGAVVPGLHAQQRVDPDCRTPSRCAGPSPATGWPRRESGRRRATARSNSFRISSRVRGLGQECRAPAHR